LEEDRASNVPNHTWQNIIQQDMATEVPVKLSTSSMVSPNYICEQLIAQSIPQLPSITPLLGGVSFEPPGYRENGLARPLEFQRQQQTPKSLTLSSASRVEDVFSIGSNDLNRPHERISHIRSGYITTAQSSTWEPHIR
jgi:hypothetical protein